MLPPHFLDVTSVMTNQEQQGEGERDGTSTKMRHWR
jgi:hypothetical protein